MPIKVFIEYKIKSEKEEMYQSLLKEVVEYHTERWGDFHILEGADQKHLFVEEFHVEDLEHYRIYKQERRQEKSQLWNKLNTCIEGGGDKVNIWAFRRMVVNVT